MGYPPLLLRTELPEWRTVLGPFFRFVHGRCACGGLRVPAEPVAAPLRPDKRPRAGGAPSRRESIPEAASPNSSAVSAAIT